LTALTQSVTPQMTQMPDGLDMAGNENSSYSQIKSLLDLVLSVLQ
jgi:hypothetical protein